MVHQLLLALGVVLAIVGASLVDPGAGLAMAGLLFILIAVDLRPRPS